MANEDEIVDPASLIKRLAPDQLGLFEPISGIMILNIDDDDYRAQLDRFGRKALIPEDVKLICTINHESYHFLQAAASGYMFDRARTAFKVLNAVPPPPEPEPDPETLQIVAESRAAIGDDPEGNARLDAALEMVKNKARFDMMNARADAGDHSLAGALVPEFFDYLDQRRAIESQPNAEGLSILGVIEGSAVLATNLLTFGAEHGATKLIEELDTLGPVYSELFAFTCAHARERTNEVALPAVALALCYERPHDAYCALVPLILEAPAGEAFARGRALFGAPPAIAAAGAWLGDALAQRNKDDSYNIYDPFHAALVENKWGVDTYDLLADARAMDRMDSFPLGMVTRTRPYGPFEQPELYARLVLSSVVLRARSRRREEREFHESLRNWAHGVVRRFVG